jgi:hypothetical protein
MAGQVVHARAAHTSLLMAQSRRSERAEAVAVKLFDLDQDQRGRLLILERS